LENIYLYNGYADLVESDCNVGTTAAADAGVLFELGTSCSVLKLQHQGADVRCHACGSSIDARPTMLTFKYVGGSALTNPQNGVALVEQDDNPVGIGAVIKCFGSSGGINFDRSTMQVFAELNSDFTVGLGGDQVLDHVTTCEVYTGAQIGFGTNIREHTQTITIATACHFGGSLNVGDVFGSIQLISYQTYDKTMSSHISGPGVGVDCGVRTVDVPEDLESDSNDDLLNIEKCGRDICTSLEESGSVLESLVFRLNLADAHVHANDQGDWKGGQVNSHSEFDPRTGSTSAIINVQGDLLSYKQKHTNGDDFEISATANGYDSLGTHITFIVQDTHTRAYKTRIKVRTKCDYPLSVGDKFGVLEIVGYVGGWNVVFERDVGNQFKRWCQACKQCKCLVWFLGWFASKQCFRCSPTHSDCCCAHRCCSHASDQWQALIQHGYGDPTNWSRSRDHRRS
jgi:hypothetical protein